MPTGPRNEYQHRGLTKVQHPAPAGAEETKWMTGNDVTRHSVAQGKGVCVCVLGGVGPEPLLVLPHLELTVGNLWFPLMKKTQTWKHNFASLRI